MIGWVFLAICGSLLLVWTLSDRPAWVGRILGYAMLAVFVATWLLIPVFIVRALL
jgi:hypothetical protein